MININITFDASGVINAIDKVNHFLMDEETMGRILQYSASAIWIPLIEKRLFKSTKQSDYDTVLNQTMFELDEDFAARSPQTFYKTEGERKIPGGYRKGEITNNIRNAIAASTPFKIGGIIAIGIGDKEMLDSVAGAIGNGSKYKIWEILQWGTGTYNPQNGSPVVRYGTQVFYDTKHKKGVIVQQTVNPGFKGREYFVQLDGEIHYADYTVSNYVLKYMRRIVKKYSYK